MSPDNYQLSGLVVGYGLAFIAVLFGIGCIVDFILGEIDRRSSGFRELRPGEIIREGDEWHMHGANWFKTERVGQVHQGDFRYRRRVDDCRSLTRWYDRIPTWIYVAALCALGWFFITGFLDSL